MRALPVLAPAKKALELCVYCPKLCRAACPVSNAEPSETLIPWGKMSTAYFLARGDVPLDEQHAAPAWACTGCGACAKRCDHENDVAGTLLSTRAALFAKGVAPEAAKRAAAGFARHCAKTDLAVARLAKRHGSQVDAGGVPLLVGCAYARALPREADDALSAAASLLERPVRPVAACCGKPLLDAGDGPGFEAARSRLRAELGAASRLVVVDPGCASVLRGALPGVSVELLVELAAARLDSLSHATETGVVRYHDPCALGRGLGLTAEPRAVLTRVLGRAPEEFDERESMAACSGAGGLLGATRPETSKAIARARVDAHLSSVSHGRPPGKIVTACAKSLLGFRSAGADADDLATWIKRAVRP